MVGHPIDDDGQQHPHCRDQEGTPPTPRRVSHVHEGHDAKQDSRNGGRCQEAAEDSIHRFGSAPLLAPFHQIRAGDRCQHTDATYQQGIHDPVHLAGDAHQRQAKNQSGDNGDLVTLKDVSRHAGTIAHVITHQVSNHGSVAGVVFLQPGLHLAHQVSAHVSRLGVNATAHAHEQRQQRAAKAKPQQRVRSSLAEEEEDGSSTEQSQAVSQHAGDGASPIRDTQRITKAGARRAGHSHIALDSHAHPNLAHRQREAGSQQEGNGPAKGNDDARISPKCLLRLGRGADNPHAEEQDNGQQADERQDGTHLPGQVGIGTLLDELPYIYHLLGALVFLQDLPAQEHGINQAQNGYPQHTKQGIHLKLSQAVH